MLGVKFIGRIRGSREDSKLRPRAIVARFRSSSIRPVPQPALLTPRFSESIDYLIRDSGVGASKLEIPRLRRPWTSGAVASERWLVDPATNRSVDAGEAARAPAGEHAGDPNYRARPTKWKIALREDIGVGTRIRDLR